MMDVPALQFSDAVKVYSRSHLWRVTRATGLDGVSLSVAKGEIFGLLGLNGAGKTTSIKLSLGLLFPTSGSVRVFGEEAGSSSAKSRIGYLPELPYIYSWLTPPEALSFYGRLSGVPAKDLKERIPMALEKVGLSSAGNKRLVDFSKGMLQRVGLAQAFIHNPDLIVMDEPVSGLDPLAVRDFRDLISGLNSAGKTIVLSSHSISEVEKLCGRVAILKAGKVARIVSQSEWQSSAGGLEKIFVEAVS